MPSSRLTRLEEQRTKKRLMVTLLGIVAIITLVFTVGIPLVVQTSIFLGNLKSTQPLSESNDTLAPFPPTLSPIPPATNQKTLTLEGYAEPESTLTLVVNGEEVKNVLLGSDGTFLFTDIELASGENMLFATATDQAGNESAPSQELTIIYKKDGPKLEIDSPQEGQTFGKNEQEIHIIGRTDSGAKVTINDRFVSVSDDGSFNFPLKLADGENVITVTAYDQAGNETKVERKVTYTP